MISVVLILVGHQPCSIDTNYHDVQEMIKPEFASEKTAFWFAVNSLWTKRHMGKLRKLFLNILSKLVLVVFAKHCRLTSVRIKVLTAWQLQVFLAFNTKFWVSFRLIWRAHEWNTFVFLNFNHHCFFLVNWLWVVLTRIFIRKYTSTLWVQAFRRRIDIEIHLLLLII